MSEKQNRKVSLISSLQILGRNTFGTRHNRQLCEEDNGSTPANWNNNHKAGRIFSLGPPFQSTGRQPPPVGGLLSSHGKEATHPYRHVSLPLSVQGYSLGVSGIDGRINSKEALEEKTKMRIRRLNPKLQQSASNAEALKSPTYLPAQTSKGSSKPAYSRIPTPSKPPGGEMYSHAVYQKEGRRSVLSSLSKRYTSLRKNVEKRNDPDKGKAEQMHLVQPNGKYSDTIKPGNQYGWETAPIRTPSQGQGIDENFPSIPFPKNTSARMPQRRSHTMIPLPVSESTPCFSAVESNRQRQSLSRNTVDRTSKQTMTSFLVQQAKVTLGERPLEKHNVDYNSSIVRNPLPGHAKKLPFRKVRIRSNSLHQQPFPYGQLTKAQSCTNKEDITFQPGGEMNSNRNRWSNNFENLRNIERARLAIHAIEPEEPFKRHIPSEFERGRHKDQVERMVPRARSATTRIPCPRQKLTTHPDGTCQVSESQPRQYWLGRFMTLTNAFHYEDSFNEPDISTGFGMLSSYSRPLKQPDTDLSSYRIKRAFMVLENVCTTEQASASLRNFRDEYITLHGSRWMK